VSKVRLVAKFKVELTKAIWSRLHTCGSYTYILVSACQEPCLVSKLKLRGLVVPTGASNLGAGLLIWRNA